MNTKNKVSNDKDVNGTSLNEGIASGREGGVARPLTSSSSEILTVCRKLVLGMLEISKIGKLGEC